MRFNIDQSILHMTVEPKSGLKPIVYRQDFQHRPGYANRVDLYCGEKLIASIITDGRSVYVQSTPKAKVVFDGGGASGCGDEVSGEGA